MSLVQKIDDNIKKSMLAKNTEALGVYRMLKSAVKYAAIEKHGASGIPTDTEVISVVRKEIKKRQDSIESYKAGGREDLAAKELAEMKILEEYLPAGLSEAEVEKIVRETITEVGATTKAQMGAVMKAVQPKIAGRADNKLISTLVQKLLS